jgi:hypothetical protein
MFAFKQDKNSVSSRVTRLGGNSAPWVIVYLGQSFENNKSSPNLGVLLSTVKDYF